MDENSQPRTYRNLCCSGYDAYVPAWHSTDCDVALLTEQARVTPASTRTRDRWNEARTGPSHLCPRNGRRPHTFQGTCDDTASWPPQRPADGQQRAALRERVTGHQEGSRGLISPSRRMFSTAPVRGLSSWCLRVSPKSTSAHQCPACAFGQKTTLRAPRWRSPRGTAPTESPDRQRSGWRPPKSGDQEDDGRPGYPKRSRRPRDTS